MANNKGLWIGIIIVFILVLLFIGIYFYLQKPGNIINNHTIPEHCISWYDGCNVCGVENGKLTVCTAIGCNDDSYKEPECREYV